jgi:hypothetical protein
MRASDEGSAAHAQDRRVQFMGEVWAAWGRGRDALRSLLAADIRAYPAGPDMLGMVIRHARRHYIFLNERLPRQAPIIERIVLAHEAVHVLRGVASTEFCHASLGMALEPAEWEVWVQTGFMLVPERYGQLWVQGHAPADILARHNDAMLVPEMVEWRGLMEIAQGKAPGNQIQARADADALLREGIQSVSAASQMIHDEQPSGFPSKIVALAKSLLPAAMLLLPEIMDWSELMALAA